jgi:hypothetical protein
MNEKDINTLITELDNCKCISETRLYWRASKLYKTLDIEFSDFDKKIEITSEYMSDLNLHKKESRDQVDPTIEILLSPEFCRNLFMLFDNNDIKIKIAQEYFDKINL